VQIFFFPDALDGKEKRSSTARFSFACSRPSIQWSFKKRKWWVWFIFFT